MKIKPTLTGSAETMLLSFYARAAYSKKKGAKWRDEKAEELVEKIDYDFAAADKDVAMSSGVIARTIVIDELVEAFIREHPDCTVVNIGCGLDTRFYRMDNGRIAWYNLDLPEVIALRDQIYQEKEAVEKSIADTGAKFVFGADCFDDLVDIAPGYQSIRDDNILPGMRRLVPAQRLVDWLPIAKKMTQKILVFEKKATL